MPENEVLENENVEMTDYDPTTWSGGDVISAVNLNKIEEAIDNLYNLIAHIEVVSMQGATTTTDGLPGYVPKPTVANADYQKFLRGDATWTNDGSTLINLNASAITSGSLAPERLGTGIDGAKIQANSITVDSLSSEGVLGSIKEGTISAEYIGDIPTQKIVVESGSTLDPATLPVFGLNTSGIVAAPASVTGGFLKDNATWAVPFRT